MAVLQWTISQSTFYACKDTVEEERAGRKKKGDERLRSREECTGSKLDKKHGTMS